MITEFARKLVCYFKGHKRGRRVSTVEGHEPETEHEFVTFACPRCGAQWTRVVKIGGSK